MFLPRRTLRLLSCATTLALGFSSAAQAATFEVTRTDDPLPNGCLAGDCSLREATIAAAEASGGDEIVLEAGPGPYELALGNLLGESEDAGVSGDLDVDEGDLKVSRAAGRYATIDANQVDRVFDVAAGEELKLARLVVTGGAALEDGGAIRAGGGLALTRVALELNTAATGGGAISLSGATTRVKSSTLSANAAERGGAIAVRRGARLRAVNSTFALNSSAGGGGAIAAEGEVRLNAVTVAANLADSDADATGAGGGLLSEGAAFVVENSLIAGNRLGAGAPSDCAGGFDSDGDNLISALDPAGCTGIDFAGDILTPTPEIGRLRDNGGPTRTVALKRRSPALDEGGPQSSPRRDQRDVKRDELPDIGAYEREVERKRPK